MRDLRFFFERKLLLFLVRDFVLLVIFSCCWFVFFISDNYVIGKVNFLDDFIVNN